MDLGGGGGLRDLGLRCFDALNAEGLLVDIRTEMDWMDS